MSDLSVGQGMMGSEWVCHRCGTFYTSKEGHSCQKKPINYDKLLSYIVFGVWIVAVVYLILSL